MRKFPLRCLPCFLLLTGCGGTHKGEREGIKNYESYVDAVLNNKGSESKIIPPDHKLSVFKQKDNSYQYEIVISNPHMTVYNIQAVVVNPALNNNSSVYSRLRLLGDDVKTPFDMILYQANGARNFVSKIFLDDISEHDQLMLQVTIIWRDSKLVNTNCIFFTRNCAQKDGEANG